MSEFINTVDLLGDDIVTDSIIERTITELADNNVTTIGESAFYGCSALTSVDFPNVTTIGANAFYGCSALTSVILRNNTLVTIDDGQVFTNAPIVSGTGYIYVPSAFYDQYVSTYSAYQFRALEDYTVDGTIYGELDESKI